MVNNEDEGEIVNFLSCDMWKLEEWITELIEINVEVEHGHMPI